MPLPVLPGVLRIQAYGTVAGGGQWANTWHARNDSLIDFDAGGIAAFDAIFRDFYMGVPEGGGFAVQDQCPTATLFSGCAYTPLDGASGSIVITWSTTGASLSNAMPAEVAEVITVRTAARGRQNRGRVYLPAWATDKFETNGKLKAAVTGQVIAQLVAVHARLQVGGAHLGVGSYGPYRDPTTHAVLSAAAAAAIGLVPHFTPAVSFSMDDMADVQRRRKT